MRKASDLQVTKIFTISIFIFLAGLFAGLFFSTGISDENSAYLSGVLISSISDPSSGFFKTFFSSLISDLLLCAIMMISVFSKFLCPLPFLILWYKSFAVGFCSYLLYAGNAENPLIMSIVKLLPQNIVLLPAFICLAAALFAYSKAELAKSKRPSHEKKGLQNIVFISLAAVAAGCMIEAIFSMVKL